MAKDKQKDGTEKPPGQYLVTLDKPLMLVDGTMLVQARHLFADKHEGKSEAELTVVGYLPLNLSNTMDALAFDRIRTIDPPAPIALGDEIVFGMQVLKEDEED